MWKEVQILSLSQLTQEELQEMSLIELAFELLSEKKQPFSFKEIMDEVTKLRGLTEEEVRARIAQFYTDLNIDGRFMSLGENRWGLRVWYPVDQSEEDTSAPVKPKKKKAKKVVDEDLDIEEYEELEEEDLDYDDVDDFEEDDLLDDDLEDDIEEDDDDLLDDEEEFDLDEDEVEEDLVEDELEIDEEEDL